MGRGGEEGLAAQGIRACCSLQLLACQPQCHVLPYLSPSFTLLCLFLLRSILSLPFSLFTSLLLFRLQTLPPCLPSLLYHPQLSASTVMAAEWPSLPTAPLRLQASAAAPHPAREQGLPQGAVGMQQQAAGAAAPQVAQEVWQQVTSIRPPPPPPPLPPPAGQVRGSAALPQTLASSSTAATVTG